MADKISYTCPDCDKDWPTAELAVLCRKTHVGEVKVTSKDPVLTRPAVTRAVKEEPIVLTYTFKGTCPICKNRINTLAIDSPGKKSKQMLIAYCFTCNKQLETREVSKLWTRLLKKW